MENCVLDRLQGQAKLKPGLTSHWPSIYIPRHCLVTLPHIIHPFCPRRSPMLTGLARALSCIGLDTHRYTVCEIQGQYQFWVGDSPVDFDCHPAGWYRRRPFHLLATNKACIVLVGSQTLLSYWLLECKVVKGFCHLEQGKCLFEPIKNLLLREQLTHCQS